MRVRVSWYRLAPSAALLTCIASCAAPVDRPLSGAMPEVDAVFSAYTDQTPGCALGVIRDGEFVYRRGYGMANLEHGAPIDADTVFRLASVSKQFTAMVVLLLAEEGRLSLDDPVRRWISELRDFGDRISIRQLIHHTSGIRDYLTLMRLAGYRDADYYSAADLLAMLARQRDLNFRPGAEHLYSNSGYFLLGEIVERVTGQSLAAAAEERIFAPLGMSQTHFHDDHTRLVPRRASGYAPGDDGLDVSMTTLPIVGDGGVLTTVNDLLAWDRNFYQNRLGSGSPELITRWLQPGALDSGEPIEYSAGITDGTYRGRRLVSHGGSYVGFRANILRFPEQRFTAIVLCNVATANPSRLGRQVADAYLADELGPRSSDAGSEVAAPAPAEFALSVAELRELEGRYVSPELRSTYVLEIAEGELYWEIPLRLRYRLVSEGRDRMRGDGWPVLFRFERDSAGRVSGFELDAGRVVDLWFERVR